MGRAAPKFCGTEASFVRLVLPQCCSLFKTGTCVLTAIVAITLQSAAAAQGRSELWSEYAFAASRDFPNESPAAFPLDDMGDLNSQRLDSTASVPFISATGDKEVDEIADEEDEEEEDEDQVTPIIEELFLGTIVYPQEQGEVQLTFGYFDGVEAVGNSQTLFEIEYGITDRFQIGFEVPTESIEEDERFEGVRNLGLELYYNFYNDRRTGRAYGVGFEFGLPVDSAAGESRTYVYEPFFVAYQDYCEFAVNFSAALEIENPSATDEATETAGEVALGIFRRAQYAVPMLELQVEIAEEETPARLAPGLYLSSIVEPFDLAVSFPIGLNDDAPDFAAYFLAVVEFEASALRAGTFR